MKEIQDIVQAFDEAQKQNKQTALATVVHVQGSSYRRPGARMLVTEEGQLTGAISGGCLEGDALRKARQVMVRQKAKLVMYDTTDEDDAKLGVGLGCNGIIYILIEPIQAGNPTNPIQLLKKYLSVRQKAVLITLFSLQDLHAEQTGTCYFQNEAGEITNNFTDKQTAELLQPIIAYALQHTVSGITTIDLLEGAQNAFVEVLQPPVRLVIIGAGNDTMPLLQMANILGWQTIVVDGRAPYATTARFPTAHQVIVSKPNQVLAYFNSDERTVFALMTHNYNYDIAMLRQLVELNIPYIGTLGPKKKLDRMLEELEAEGIFLTQNQRNKIYGPAGLNIGAETAEEIALSIVAEIKAALTRKNGTSLRNLEDPIHFRETNLFPENKVLT
ncbi:MAG: alanine dehydrogenase [Cytophagales bacterium CG18_big_fil_WC_8_21_14_2_50_42_9]|nr:MAG: alanine dehydrogenase [Cytophagales bacterium CG18_big_fil_WC_8_21_14_2_50_42_9]